MNNGVRSLGSLFSIIFRFLKADKQTMKGDSIWGSWDFQVPEYFNFTDALDDWEGKEKVTRYCSLKTNLNFSFSLENYKLS